MITMGEDCLRANTCYRLMEHVAKLVDPAISFERVDDMAMVVVEHETTRTGSGRKRRRPPTPSRRVSIVW